MGLNFNYRFRKIQIQEPEFSRFYFDLFKKVDYQTYHAVVVNAIKNQLRNLVSEGTIEVGVMIDTEKHLYKPLQSHGYPENHVNYILRDLGPNGEQYLDKYADGSSLQLTPKGKAWVFDMGNNQQKNNNMGQINFFTIPPLASDKLKLLLKEINELPAIGPYSNLIAHQLRTILALILRHTCKDTLKVPIPPDDKGLKFLLNYTIAECVKQKNNHLSTELAELKNSKYKEIIDDIIHDDHTTVNEIITEKMATHIKHILSLAYRNS